MQTESRSWCTTCQRNFDSHKNCSWNRFVADIFIQNVWKLQTSRLLLKMQMFKMKQITESEVSCQVVSCQVLKWRDWTWHMVSWSHQPAHAQCLPRPARASSKQKTLSYNYFRRSKTSEQRCCLNIKIKWWEEPDVFFMLVSNLTQQMSVEDKGVIGHSTSQTHRTSVSIKTMQNTMKEKNGKRCSNSGKFKALNHSKSETWQETINYFWGFPLL